MFTYDCFYYPLIDLLQIFVSKEFTALYSLSGFMNKGLQRRELAVQSPLQGEKSSVEQSVWEHCSVLNGEGRGIS